MAAAKKAMREGQKNTRRVHAVLAYKCRWCGQMFYEPLKEAGFETSLFMISTHVCSLADKKYPDILPERRGIGDLIGWKLVRKLKEKK